MTETTNKTTVTIPATNLNRLKERFADLQKKADKLINKHGLVMTEELTLSHGDFYPIHKNVDGLKVTEVYVDVTVTGVAPKLEGWDLLAQIDHKSGGLINDIARNGADLTGYRGAKALCEHCNTVRPRNATYIVEKDGDRKQVGSNCLRDFTGHKSPEAILTLAQLIIELHDAAEEAPGWTSVGNLTTVEDYLAYVALAIRLSGWVSRGTARMSYSGETASADLAWSLRHNKQRKASKPEEQDYETARKALEWTRADLASKTNLGDYEYNLNIVVNQEIVTGKTDGLLASVIPYYKRGVGEEIKRQARAKSQWVGEPKKRETFELTLVSVNSFEGAYGTTHVHNFVDGDGNEFVWFSSSANLERDFDAGETFRAKATVKKHETYKGIKQTYITRVKVVEA